MGCREKWTEASLASREAASLPTPQFMSGTGGASWHSVHLSFLGLTTSCPSPSLEAPTASIPQLRLWAGDRHLGFA